MTPERESLIRKRWGEVRNDAFLRMRREHAETYACWITDPRETPIAPGRPESLTAEQIWFKLTPVCRGPGRVVIGLLAVCEGITVEGPNQ